MSTKKYNYQLRARADKSLAGRVKAAAHFAHQSMGQFIRVAVKKRLEVVEKNMARQSSFSTSTQAGNVVPFTSHLEVTDNGSILSPIEQDDAFSPYDDTIGEDEPTKPGVDPKLVRFLEDEYGIEEGLGAQDIED